MESKNAIIGKMVLGASYFHEMPGITSLNSPLKIEYAAYFNSILGRNFSYVEFNSLRS